MAWTRLFRRGRLRRRRRSDERPYESQRGPKIHVGEIYGFVGAITWSVFAVLYFAWAYLPAETLHEWGIHFLPDKYWALALPVFISVTVVAIYWVYEGLSMYYSQPIHSVGSFQGKKERSIKHMKRFSVTIVITVIMVFFLFLVRLVVASFEYET